MKIHGLQKMTLLDYPGKVACTVFFGGCDMRCPFCHNAELLDGSAPPVMDEQELLSFLKKRKGLLDGVAITGGEPLLQKDLSSLLGRIRDLGYPVKLDTNGTHPERLYSMIVKGLVQYTAMDIKNAPDRYAETVGLSSFDMAPVRESVSLLMEDRIDYEFRTTVVAELHDDNCFDQIGKWIRGAKRYYLQRFTDRNSVPFAGLHAPSDEQLFHWADMLRRDVPSTALRGVDTERM
jgi:pyruvate formate lyase activating enzyme